MKKLLIIFLLLITIPVNASSIVMDIDSKRILYEDLSQDIKNYITESLNYLETYLIDIDKNSDSITELQKCFERFNLIE